MSTIKYLSNISLENLELQNAKIQVVASDPVLSGSTYEGRIIYNSTDNAIKFHNGATSNYWVTLDGSGDISSVTVNAGEGLEVEAGSSSASSGDFSVTLGLKSNVAGTYLGYSSGVINHDSTSRTDTTSTTSPGYSGTFPAVTGVTTNATGHITAINVSTVTMPSAQTVNNSQITVNAGTYISLGTGQDGIFTLNQGSNEAITLNHDTTTRSNTTSSASPGYGATFTAVDSITTNSTGHVTAVNTKTVTIPADTNTDTLQSIAADTSNNDRFITTVANASGAQTGLSHSTLTYNPSTETLNVTNLVVSGTSTTINTEEINLADNIIVLNSNYSGSSPTEDAGIEVERGTADSNVSLIWDESTNRWTFTNNGTTFYNIPISSEYNNYSHPTQSAISVNNSGVTFIQDITVNTLGHVTSVSSGTVPNASTTAKGIIEIATQTEVNTGTDTGRAVTPSTLSTYVGNQSFQVALNAAQSSVTKTGNEYTVTHGLASRNLIVQVMDTTDYATVHVDVTRPTTSTIKVSFAATVTDGDYHVMITKVA